MHQADLLRVDGVTPELAELLYQAGVTSAPKLAYRSSDSLYAELVSLAGDQVVPSARELHQCITAARRLPKLVRH